MSQVAPVLHRPPVQIEPRKPLTRRQLIELMLRQDGKCDCGCGAKLAVAGEDVIDEHIIPLALGGSNDLSNRALFRRPCAKDKTKVDAWRNAKANRLIKAADPEQRKPSRLQGRQFQTDLTKGVSGKVRPRRAKQSRGS